MKTTKPKSNHPWNVQYRNKIKLKEARAERRRIYERTSEVINDEYRKLMRAKYAKISRARKAMQSEPIL